MVAIGIGKFGQAGAIEVDPVVVGEVGILAGVHPARLEPDLPLVLIHAVHHAHHPLALGDLVLHLAGDAVIKVKMLPAVTLRGPDDLLAVIQVVAVPAPAGKTLGQQVVVDEGLAGLVDQRARLAGLRVHLDHAVDLVAALIVLEGEAAAILPPHRRCEVVRVGKQRLVDLRLLLRGHVEEGRKRDIQRVPRLAVKNRRVLRLKLVGGRRFDVVYLPVVPRPRVIGHQFPGIRRPRDRAQGVVVAFRAIQAQRRRPARWSQPGAGKR